MFPTDFSYLVIKLKEYKLPIMKRFILLFLVCLGVASEQNLAAQTKATEISDLANQILLERKTSNDLLNKYTWTSRTEILK